MIDPKFCEVAFATSPNVLHVAAVGMNANRSRTFLHGQQNGQRRRRLPHRICELFRVNRIVGSDGAGWTAWNRSRHNPDCKWGLDLTQSPARREETANSKSDSLRITNQRHGDIFGVDYSSPERLRVIGMLPAILETTCSESLKMKL